MTCESSYVLYLATCKRCKGQYVGKSQTAFKLRHSNHKQEIKHGRGGLGQHYGPKGRCSYQDISFILIEKVEEGAKTKLARREQYWQHQLRAFVENGGNAHCIKKRNYIVSFTCKNFFSCNQIKQLMLIYATVMDISIWYGSYF